MSIRFAPAANRLRALRMPQWQVRAAATTGRLLAANDNLLRQVRADALHAALHHFATHGLAAARLAGERALAALAQGDEQGHASWLDICRTLDRRMATRIEHQAKAG